jgi:hypothetical protein
MIRINKALPLLLLAIVSAQAKTSIYDYLDNGRSWIDGDCGKVNIASFLNTNLVRDKYEAVSY